MVGGYARGTALHDLFDFALSGEPSVILTVLDEAQQLVGCDQIVQYYNLSSMGRDALWCDYFGELLGKLTNICSRSFYCIGNIVPAATF